MTPRFAVVPLTPDEKMIDAARESDAGLCRQDAMDAHAAMIAASPSAGRIGAEALERAAAAIYETSEAMDALWADLTDWHKARYLSWARAAFEAAGIGVEGGAE